MLGGMITFRDPSVKKSLKNIIQSLFKRIQLKFDLVLSKTFECEQFYFIKVILERLCNEQHLVAANPRLSQRINNISSDACRDQHDMQNKSLINNSFTLN